MAKSKICGRPARYIDCFHPYHDEYNRCEMHKDTEITSSNVKVCGVCALTATNLDREYYDFDEARGVYQVGFSDICKSCGKKASSFVNYYGFKKDSDLLSLNQFLCGGWVVRNQYSQLMNAGYY